MSFINLHFKGKPCTVNTKYITSVFSRNSHPGSVIWMLNDAEPLIVDETILEVISKISASTDAEGVEVNGDHDDDQGCVWSSSCGHEYCNMEECPEYEPDCPF